MIDPKSKNCKKVMFTKSLTYNLKGLSDGEDENITE